MHMIHWWALGAPDNAQASHNVHVEESLTDYIGSGIQIKDACCIQVLMTDDGEHLMGNAVNEGEAARGYPSLEEATQPPAATPPDATGNEV